MRARGKRVQEALSNGAERAATFAGPKASSLCMLVQRRVGGAMADRRAGRTGRGADRRRALREGAEGA